MNEILTCSNCQKMLQIPEQYVGETVQCPHCGLTFVAASTRVSAQPAPSAPAESRPAPAPKRWEDDEDDRDIRRRRRDDDEFDDDDFDHGLRVRHNLPPNRSGLVLALGLVSLIGGWLFCLPIVIGPIAWYLAQSDLRAIRTGEMDSKGEGELRTGQVCGIISTVILVIAVGGIGFFILASIGF